MYDNQDIQEKAPPGAKYERMVKHIKKRYAQDGLTDKEKVIAYATAWKQHGKTHKEEAGDGYLGPARLGIKNPMASDATRAAADQKRKQQAAAAVKSGQRPTLGGSGSYANQFDAIRSELKQSYEPEGDQIDERRKEDKVAGTPRKPRNLAFELVAKSMGTGRMGVKPRGQKKEPGKKPPAAGEYGSERRSPAQQVAKRRADAQRSQDMMHSRFDHFEMDGNDLQEKYLYTYLYERNYDALDKDADGDKDFADVMIARMIASGKSREEAIKATMSKEYNKKGKKVKISDEFSDWRTELGEEHAKKSPFVDVMPKDDTSTDESESLKAARKRQQPNQKVTAESLEEFADSLGGFLVEAEQLNEFVAPLARVVTTLAKSPAVRSAVVKGPRAFKPSVPKPVKTPGTKPSTPVPVKPVPTPKPGTKPAPAPAKPKTEPTPAPAKPQVKPEVEKATKPKVQRPVKTAVATAAATSATAALLQPLVKPSPTTEKELTRRQTPTGPGGGKGPGKGGTAGAPIPFKLPKLDYQHTVGYTQNPQ